MGQNDRLHLQSLISSSNGQGQAEKTDAKSLCDKTPTPSIYIPPNPQQDTLDVKAALSGDEAALERLFCRYKDLVIKICLKYCRRDAAQALDLCQETFINAFRELKHLRDPSRFFFWLAEIARNNGLLHLRKQRVLQKNLQEYQVVKGALRDGRPRWSETEIELIREFLRTTESPEMQETVRLFYVEGWKTAEIAEIQGITQTAVTTRLNRFRTRLRARLMQKVLKLRKERS
jgi:RNA polymerase sigma-70 factor (ECF subfamily)